MSDNLDKPPESYAFPHSRHFDCQRGMELRDYLAGQCAAGFCAANPEVTVEVFAERSYAIADAMLKEREK